MGMHLGEFEVVEPLASGGMGQVWRARHPGQDLPVAVKVMADDLAEIPSWRDRFRTEVRAMAALEHPGVVWVFDYGEVPAETARKMGVADRVPWVAMEFASAGTLDERIGRLSWTSVRALLLSLLDTLSHAHARKVIHRDLKPANVLLCGPDDLRPGPKLTDFGIAATLDEDTSDGRMLGTPGYMAPEQILALRADLGPWTDLYALGCMAWEMVAGAPPFDSEQRSEVLFAHLSNPLPELQPLIAVPAELSSWLETLLAKAPDRRFGSAADAAYALRALSEIPTEEPDDDPAIIQLLRSTAHSTMPLTRTSDRKDSPGPRATWFDDATLTEASVELDLGHTNSEDWPIPGCPLDWRRPIPVRRSRQLQGAGLGLVGLRAVPLAGRDLERDALWQSLVAVHATGQARGIVLRGSAGTGKSRLARWLGERALEVGAARYLVARHSPDDVPGEGIAAALRHELRTFERPRGQRKARLVEMLGETLGDAVAAWLHPEDEPDRTMASSAERHAMIGEVLERMAAQRALILHLDDAQFSGDALILADYLMKRQGVAPSRVLILLTIQEEALAETPRYARRLAELGEQDEVATIPLEPLSGVHRVALLDGLLGLDGATASRVLERTGGNPLFAVQLVGEWAANGLLVPGRRGFKLSDPDAVDAIDGLDAIWRPRIERVLDGLLPDAGVWLERVALAGGPVREMERDPLAEGLDLGIDRAGMRTEVLDRLCEARLGQWTEGQFTFVHGLVREALRARAAEAGRLAEHHAVLADGLVQRTGVDPVTIGRHLLLANQPQRAVRYLVHGLRDHRRRFGGRAGLAASELAEQALEAARVPRSAPNWGTVWLEKMFALREVGDGEGADELLDAVGELSLEHGWPPEIRLTAKIQRTKQTIYAEQLDEAEAMLAEIESDPECSGIYLAQVYFWRYAMGEYLNDMDRSRTWGTKAAAIYEQVGDPDSRLLAAQIRGVLGFMFADIDEAEPWILEALNRSEHAAVQQKARLLHNLGKVHWYRGRLDEAEAAFVQSEELYLQSGSVRLGAPRFMRIHVRLAQKRYAEALHLCQDLRDQKGSYGEEGESLELLELVARAGLGEWDGFSARFERIAGKFRTRDRANGEDATAFETLGRVALAAGELKLARQAWEMALDHWQRHDKREHEEAKVEEWIEDLPTEHT